MDDQQFQREADKALSALYRSLIEASDNYGFEPDLNNGALTVEFEEQRTRFVVSPNSPVRQIWVSANVRSYKLDWNEHASAFVLPDDGRTLRRLMADAIGELLGEAVTLP
ncbi:MAG: iron donor protein CyaY [Acidobacteria bacterium]|nr:iron donor protein CyaY [Acidobacteriota bacterium]